MSAHNNSSSPQPNGTADLRDLIERCLDLSDAAGKTLVSVKLSEALDALDEDTD